MIRIGGLMWILTVLVLLGCSNSQSSESMDTAFSGPSGLPPNAPPLEGEASFSPSLGHPERIWSLDTETLIDTSDTIARVRLIEVASYMAVATPEHLNGDKLYSPYMGFKFEVLEYLMGGNGHSTIWGMVKLDEADRSSEEEALTAYAFYLRNRDTSWDDKEAVVFLSNSLPDWPSTHATDRYALGYFESSPLVERYSIAANFLAAVSVCERSHGSFRFDWLQGIFVGPSQSLRASKWMWDKRSVWGVRKFCVCIHS